MGVAKKGGISINIAFLTLYFVVANNHKLHVEVSTTKKYLHPMILGVDIFLNIPHVLP